MRWDAGRCRAALWCCAIVAALASGLAAAGTQAAPATGRRASGVGVDPTRWELRGVVAPQGRGRLLGMVSPGSSPSRAARRSLSETNDQSSPCAAEIKGSDEAQKCCADLSHQEAACKQAAPTCEWEPGNHENGKNQESACLGVKHHSGGNTALYLFFGAMALLVTVPMYKCCCAAKMVKQSQVSLEPLEPQLTASTQMYWASQN